VDDINDLVALTRTHGPITDPAALALDVFGYGADDTALLFPGERYAIVEDGADTAKAIIYGHVTAQVVTVELGGLLADDGYHIRSGAPAAHEHVLVLTHSPYCRVGTAGTGCGCGGGDEPWYMIDAPSLVPGAIPVTMLDLMTENAPADDADLYAGLPDNHVARFDGHPGLVWFAEVRRVRGDKLQIGDWLDSLDHRGARCIYGLWAGDISAAELADAMLRLDAPQPDSPVRTVMIGGGETETIRVDVEYDVVNPDSQVTPDGTPVVTDYSPRDDLAA
jgi:hypothetical protein